MLLLNIFLGNPMKKKLLCLGFFISLICAAPRCSCGLFDTLGETLVTGFEIAIIIPFIPLIAYDQYITEPRRKKTEQLDKYGERVIKCCPPGSIARIKKLIEVENFPVDGPHDDGMPMRMALKKNRLDIVEYLWTHGANLNAGDGYITSTAARTGNLQAVAWLLDRGATISSGAFTHSTNNPKMFYYLLSQGASLTPFFEGYGNSSKELVIARFCHDDFCLADYFLGDNLINPHKKIECGGTMVHWAANYRYANPMLAWLVNRKVSVNTLDNKGKFPVDWCLGDSNLAYLFIMGAQVPCGKKWKEEKSLRGFITYYTAHTKTGARKLLARCNSLADLCTTLITSFGFTPQSYHKIDQGDLWWLTCIDCPLSQEILRHKEQLDAMEEEWERGHLNNPRNYRDTSVAEVRSPFIHITIPGSIEAGTLQQIASKKLQEKTQQNKFRDQLMRKIRNDDNCYCDTNIVI